ncbi:hypothetical protein BDD43_3384 [Mucilaginibacter gracilis]|uniref:Uncharacterized protein n=1 Tax=Mucilaginibacter gracilis TaxID=423350 RepID=A0A495J3J8_9SPHI|nr:hypothetical protein [Mucilaginibacter gracilis]RKR83182.1 hypothetical protein BDD43_3384 [Mucilaginibacter gracilis]
MSAVTVAGFDNRSNEPLDAKYIVTDLAALSTLRFYHQGMVRWVQAENWFYVLSNDLITWKQLPKGKGVQKWVAGSYNEFDLVLYNGKIYESQINNNNVLPDTDADKWVIITGDAITIDEVNSVVADAVNNLLTALANEATNRVNGDAALQSNINAEVTTRSAADATLQANIDSNTTAIATEATNRANGDATLQTNINAEATTRLAADTVLQTNIDNNATAIASEVTNRTNAIADEATNRVNGDAALQTQLSALSSALIPHPTYTTPTAVLSSTQSTSGLEVGQTVNIPLTVAFNQNDGGAQGAMSVKKDGTQIATASPYTDSAVVMALTAKVYQANVAYAQGPIKNNIIGVPDATGRIAASSVNSNSLSYQGYYKIFYDAVAAFPTNSATARALTNSRFSNSGNTFTLNTGTVQTKFCLILPPGKTLVSVIDQDALNLDITSQYVASSITVNDAAGNSVTTYTIYAMSQSIPYTASHRHNITIA